MDPFDAFFLESLLSGNDTSAASSTRSRTYFRQESPSIPAHATLSAFLAEMDALDRDSDDSDFSENPSRSPIQQDAAANTSITNASPTPGRPDALHPVDRAIALALEPTRPVRTLKRRIRPKEELDTLRVTAVKLQRDLDELQTNASTRKRMSEQVIPAKLARISAPPERAVATKEEIENRELRELLETQLSFVEQFGKELSKCHRKGVRRSSFL